MINPSTQTTTTIPGFDTEQHGFLGQTKAVFRRGKGPAVVVLAEVPGITPQVADFARGLADHGFTVFMPQLFGTPLRPLSVPLALGTIAKLCISKEFRVLAANESSPVVDWLRALSRHAHHVCGGPGVGVVGMCITGNFGLAMMLDAPVIAPVLCQPSLPGGFLPSQVAGLHASDQEIAAAHEKIDSQNARILGLRFKQDFLCQAERFKRLKQEFGDAFEGIEIDAKFAKKNTGTPAHSVLTTHLIDESGEPTRAALDRTMEFLATQLGVGQTPRNP
jgi:dienelactone hydrolase